MIGKLEACFEKCKEHGFLRGLVSDIHDDDLELSDFKENGVIGGFFGALSEDDCKRLFETDFEHGYNTDDV